MELKNAVAVCLISFFSATLVLLIARALDMQAASQLEPQLAQIVEELRALRKQGGVPQSPGVASGDEVLVVYYFHGTQRCVTCQLIESQARETVETHFPELLKRGTIVWKTVNYDLPSNASLAKRFKIAMPMVVLAAESGQEIRRWKTLDDVWPLSRDKERFLSYVRKEIESMLPGRAAAPSSRSAVQQPASPQSAAEGPALSGYEPAVPPQMSR